MDLDGPATATGVVPIVTPPTSVDVGATTGVGAIIGTTAIVGGACSTLSMTTLSL